MRGHFEYAFFKIGRINSVIRKKISAINNYFDVYNTALGKVITKEESIKHLDHPDVDLFDL